MKKEFFFRKKSTLLCFYSSSFKFLKVGNAVLYDKSVILVSILVLFKCPRLGRRRFFHSSIPTLLYLGVIQQLLPICVPCVSKFASLVKRNFPKDQLLCVFLRTPTRLLRASGFLNPTIYNIISWFAGTNDLSTKCLMFQVFFFS